MTLHRALVVVAGFLILSGAVNTSMIGSNGVLNRVAEDGVLPERLQKPHPKYGTTYRILYLIFGLQLFTIIASRGNMVLLGEAYAFGVLWSFLFNALSMLVLRFKDRRPREFKVPLNIQLGSFELPLGLGLIALVLAITAVINLFTKEVATVSGMIFTAVFLSVFTITECYTKNRRKGAAHEHLEQFSEKSSDVVTGDVIGLTKQYRKLVSIRSPENLYMLQKSLEETDPETTDVIVMTAKHIPPGGHPADGTEIDRYDQRLITAVIEMAEKVGKQIKPLVVPTNNPLYAIINTAKSLNVQELVLGASNKFTAEEQLDQMAFYWINLHDGEAAPLTIRLLSRNLDVHYDVGGGSRIPKISERQAQSVAELRAGGVGVKRVLMAHDGTSNSSDLFESVLTMLDPEVGLALLITPPSETLESTHATGSLVASDCERARKLGRELEVHELKGDRDIGAAAVQLIREKDYDALILCAHVQRDTPEAAKLDWTEYVRQHAPCPIFLGSLPAIPREVDADEGERRGGS